MFFIALFILLLLIVWVGTRSSSTKRVSAPKLEKELLNLCLGDKEMAIRLTLHELKRNPEISHTEAIRSAIQSYKRDS